MTADESANGDATHMRVLGDALVAAGNPVWRTWRCDFDWMYLELEQPLDFAVAERVVEDDGRVDMDADNDRISCMHCEHEIFGYARALDTASRFRLLSRAASFTSTLSDRRCEHLELALEGLIADGNYVVTDPTFAPVGAILQCEVGERIDISRVERRLPAWSRLVACEDDDEIFCHACSASIVGPGFPWDRAIHVVIDYSKLERVSDPPSRPASIPWWRRRRTR